MRYPDAEMTMKGYAEFIEEYLTPNVIKSAAVSGQKVIPLAKTTDFNATGGVKGNRVIIGRGTPREEKGTVASIQSGTSITLASSLLYNHTLNATTTVSAKTEDKPADGASEFLSGGSWTADDWTSDSGYIHDVGTVEVALLINPGKDYQVNDVLKLIDDANETCQIKVLTVDAETGAILTYSITNKGKGYTVKDDLPTDYVTSGTGNGAVFSVVVVNNTTELTYNKPAVTGTRYQLSITIANRTDGNIEVKFGGQWFNYLYMAKNDIFVTKTKAINTDILRIVPSPTFDGKVTVSIKEITKVLPVTATTGFVVGETVYVGNNETYTIYSIQAATSLTMVENLKRTHEADEEVLQVGEASTVEVCWREASRPILKPYHSNILFFIPANWTTAKITFLVSDDPYGDYTPMEFIIPVWDSDAEEIVTDEIKLITDEINTGGTKAYAFSWGGALRDVLAGLPYIKLLSGEVASEVDQGADPVVVKYFMTR